MAKQVSVIVQLTAEDWSYVDAVMQRELAAEKPHWSEPAPADFLTRLDASRKVALSTQDTEIQRLAQENEDLKEQLETRTVRG